LSKSDREFVRLLNKLTNEEKIEIKKIISALKKE
jgi:hypothetical protein